MRRILLFFTLFLWLIFSCGENENGYKEITRVVKGWIINNDNVSDGFLLVVNGNKVEVTLFVVASSSSKAIEDMLATNLAIHIYRLPSLPVSIDSVFVNFDLPKSVAVYGQDDKKVTTNYGYSIKHLSGINYLFTSSPQLFNLSQYITQELTDKDELELKEIPKFVGSLFAWFPYHNSNGLEVIYAFSYNNAVGMTNDTREKYQVSLSTIQKSLKELEGTSLPKLDAMLDIVGLELLDLPFSDLDSIGTLVYEVPTD